MPVASLNDAARAASLARLFECFRGGKLPEYKGSILLESSLL